MGITSTGLGGGDPCGELEVAPATALLAAALPTAAALCAVLAAFRAALAALFAAPHPASPAASAKPAKITTACRMLTSFRQALLYPPTKQLYTLSMIRNNSQGATVVGPPGVSSQVLDYATDHDLLPYLSTAIRLAETVFSPAQPTNVELETDPETGQQRLVVEVILAATMDQAATRYDEYVRQWIAAAPPHVLLEIGLSYDIRLPR